jgi:RNA-binding protein YhbY
MTRTITQIQGEYGLNQNAEDDPFKNLEESVLSNVDKMLQERESARIEMDAAKGFGRSTFHDAISAKQEGDVISQVGTQFAQARQQDALAQRQMERTITQAAVGHDLDVSKMEEQSRIQQEQYKTHEEIYADRALGEQMKLFSQEKSNMLQNIKSQFDAGELDEAEYFEQSQVAISQLATQQKEALEQARVDGRISSSTALDRQMSLVEHEYVERLKLMNEDFANKMRSQFGEDVIDENGNLNPDYRGETAERFYYSMMLDRQKLINEMQTEQVKGQIQLNNTLLANVLGNIDLDQHDGTLKALGSIAALLGSSYITNMIQSNQVSGGISNLTMPSKEEFFA